MCMCMRLCIDVCLYVSAFRGESFRVFHVLGSASLAGVDICICTCTCTFTFKCICTYIYTCICVYTCVCVCVYVSAWRGRQSCAFPTCQVPPLWRWQKYVHVYVYAYLHVNVYVHIYVFVYIFCACVCVCVCACRGRRLTEFRTCLVQPLRKRALAKEPYKRDDVLKKRPTILRSLLIGRRLSEFRTCLV